MYTPEREPGKGEGPRSPPLQLTKTAAQEDGGGEEDLQGEQTERRERERLPDLDHLYGLCPELGLVWGGRGAAGARGPKFVSEEKESGEEWQRQDEAH